MEIKERKRDKLRILMINFNLVVREGFQAIMSKDDGLEVVRDVLNGEASLQYIKRADSPGRPVNIVLTETRNGVVDGMQVIMLIKDGFPEIAVLVLTENVNDSYVIDAIHAGASGYIFLKEVSAETLLKSIRRAVEGSTQITDGHCCALSLSICFKIAERPLPSVLLRHLNLPREKSMC